MEKREGSQGKREKIGGMTRAKKGGSPGESMEIDKLRLKEGILREAL